MAVQDKELSRLTKVAVVKLGVFGADKQLISFTTSVSRTAALPLPHTSDSCSRVARNGARSATSCNPRTPPSVAHAPLHGSSERPPPSVPREIGMS
jgi:hypothetical protein